VDGVVRPCYLNMLGFGKKHKLTSQLAELKLLLTLFKLRPLNREGQCRDIDELQPYTLMNQAQADDAARAVQ